MPPVNTTYSFKDLTGVLTNPLLGGAPVPLVGGNIGNGQITIRMLTQRTELETAADGTVMPSYISGASAEVLIEMQQTSALHHALLDLYNLLVTAAEDGDVSGWASTVISLRTVLDGSGHFLSGVAFQKIPDKPYAAKGQNVTWTLMVASCIQQ
jgi:hypothetical protein